MQKRNRLEKGIKKKLLLNAEELFDALGIALTDGQKETTTNAQAQRVRDKEQRKKYRISHKENNRRYNKTYRIKHGDNIKIYQREYYKKHREEYCKKVQAYREKNREKICEKKRKYRQANAAKIRERKRAYYETHKEEVKAKTREYRAAKKARQNGELVGGQTSRSASCVNVLSDQHRKICATNNAKKGIPHENQRRNDGRGV